MSDEDPMTTAEAFKENTGDDESVMRPPDRDVLWRRALQASGKAKELLAICGMWTPDEPTALIAPIVREFCAHFTDIVPACDGKEPLIVKCLRTAVTRWGQAAGRKPVESACFHAFIYGLFEPVPEVNGWCVCLPQLGDDVVWDPVEISLWSWWERYGRRPQLLRRDHHLIAIADGDLRLFIATRVLDRIDASHLPGGLRSILRHLTPV
jgi:hypothetical protein